jgi:hypothetical protein
VHDVEKATLLRVSDQNESRLVKRVRVVSAKLVVERGLGFLERDSGAYPGPPA